MSGIIEQINSLDSSVKLLVAGIGILMAILVSRFAIVKPWLKVVKMTSVEWDDELHAPISNRLYSFILVGGIHFSLNWIYPEDGEWVTSVSRI